MHHVIIGNGIAGMEAAIRLRTRDATATITLIGAEHDHLFARRRTSACARPTMGSQPLKRLKQRSIVGSAAAKVQEQVTLTA